MNSFILLGNIIYSPAAGGLSISEDSYLVCENGACAGIFSQIPEQYKGLPVADHSGKLIIPGMTDLHLHAPQYPNLGLGMDMELLDWLDTFTFPIETRFSDINFAAAAYGRFMSELRKSASTRAAIFGTIHTEATLLLMELMEKSGLRGYVGRVNMDRNSPEALCETGWEAGLSDTKKWLDACKGFYRVKPILTPRFVPSCTGELMRSLGSLAAERNLPIQSHLSENTSEISWVASLHPDCPSYASVYQKYGLMTPETIMAHCIYLTEDEIDIMSTSEAYIAHCPISNTNLSSGIAPIRRYIEAGLNIGLGSDISGGHSLDLFDVMREALDASKLYRQLVSDRAPALKTHEVFRLATLGGGSFFGEVGSFEPSYEFDALVIDDSRLFSGRDISAYERFERMIYLCDSRDICEKYVAGKQIEL